MARAALMYQSYDLSRYFEGDLPHSTSITVSDDDAINCAHMLAAGFNTMSRSLMKGYVLGVVNTKAGTVEYDGKIEKIEKIDCPEPESERKTELCGMTYGPALYGHEGTMCNYSPGHRGECGRTEDAPEPSKYQFISRPVLEAAYDELQAVKEVLADAGVETIPADAGATDLRALLRARDAEISELVQALANWVVENEAARAELIEHVKRAYAKWGEVDPGRQRESLKAHLRGMLEVLSKFLAATGEADADERHAVALRVCEIPEGNYLYDDA